MSDGDGAPQRVDEDTRATLARMTRAELYDIARTRELPGRSGMSRQELIDLLARLPATSDEMAPGASLVHQNDSATAASETSQRTVEAAALRRGLYPGGRPSPNVDAAIGLLVGMMLSAALLAADYAHVPQYPW